MNKSRKPSPARSQGAVRTPTRLKPRRSLSVTSQRSNGSGILSDLHKRNMESFVLSPLVRKSILTDNTEIEEPRRKSWWKNLDENSRDIELLDENQILEANNIIEELDIEVFSQGKKNYTMDLPESSGSESINSIVIPQRKLFTQKENLPLKKFGEIIGARETFTKLHKPNTDKTINTGTRELFQNKQRSKPIFPAGLLNISPDKTAADKTKEFTAEPKSQVRNIFGNRSTKRKNIFTNFIESESEGEISEIQPKVFGFQKKLEAKRRGSSSSRGIREHSPTSSITTDIEMDDWKMLPSSTMVEHQLEILMTGQTPKRARLSKLTEIESEAGSNATKHSNKSASSNNMDKSRKSKTFTKEKGPDSEFVTNKNMSKISQDEQEISGQNQDKSRKSKTFTKEKAPELETVINMLHVSHEKIEEIIDKNKSLQDKSRKSKTFTKEKAPHSETSMSNKLKGSQDDEVFVQNQVANKSKSKIAEKNTSLSSIKTRSQNKSNLPDSSQIIEEPVLIFFANKSKSMNLAINPKDANLNSEAIPPTADQDNDEELNFTLQYENENNEDQEIDEISEIQNISTIETSKSNKVNEELEELEYTEEKNNCSVKAKVKENKNEMDIDNVELGLEQSEDKSIDHKKIDQEVDNENNVESEEENIDKTSQEVDEENHEESGVKNKVPEEDEIEDQNESKVIQEHCIIQDQSEDPKNKNPVIEVENEEGQNENQEKLDDSEIEKNKSQEEDEDEEEDQDQNESQELEHEIEEDNHDQNESQEVEHENEAEDLEQNRCQEVEDENEDEDVEQNSEIEQNKSQELEHEIEEDHDQNESQEVEHENEEEDLKQNNCQEVEDINEEDHLEQNKSQEVEDENEEEYQENTSQEEIEQGTEMEQNESVIQDTEENESEDENQEESEAMADSDDENDNEPDNIQKDIANESNNHDTESDQDENQEVDQVIETPNVSHDTTGRNRKKNESPEAILRDSNNHLDSFAVQGRNTSVMRPEMIQTMNIQPIFAPVRESTGFSDGNSNEGSGWDSHRTTRKTLRQTYGREFTPRKSLRALVMEKSAKRRTQHNEIASVTAPFPQANSTEMPDTSNRYDDGNEVHENQETNHEVSLRTRQKTLETYFQEVRKKNAETRLRIEEEVRNSLNAPPKHHIFKIPAKPLFARRTKPPPKPKQNNAKSALIFGELPEEFIEDMKYKPPKRFQPGNAPWITKHLYKYLETKLEPKYDYKARIRAEKLVEGIYNFTRDLRRRDVAAHDAVSVLKREMARLNVVKTHFDFYEFFHQFMPREVREKVIPDVVNNISLPRHGVFADIL